MKEAAGDRDMFILTARAPESAPAIKQFLDAMGINIPLKNITGLGNSAGKAKADWLVGKAVKTNISLSPAASFIFHYIK